MTDLEMLKKLAEEEGYPNTDEMLSAAVMDSSVPGICTECYCTVRDCEPDARENWCPGCEGSTVKSCLVLAGVI